MTTQELIEAQAQFAEDLAYEIRSDHQIDLPGVEILDLLGVLGLALVPSPTNIASQAFIESLKA